MDVRIEARVLKMSLPEDLTLPFFAYGIFKKGEISFHCIRDYVRDVTNYVELPFKLYVRDGIPLVDSNDKNGRTQGCLIRFDERLLEEAYGKISALEPEKYYRWQTTEINGNKVNFLTGKSPTTGSVPAESSDWNSWDDPLFTDVFDILKRANDITSIDITGKAFLELQMIYLLLWVSIERFASLRYGFRGERVIDKLHKMAKTVEFSNALKFQLSRNSGREPRKIFSADSVEKHYSLSHENPVEAIDYYYQIRCNIAHRGKAAIEDAKLVRKCIIELTNIFRIVLTQSQNNE
jgi:hypothetical protein